jgi:hypothetical protein
LQGNDWSAREYVDEVPLEGEIYTIRKIRLSGRDNVNAGSAGDSMS